MNFRNILVVLMSMLWLGTDGDSTDGSGFVVLPEEPCLEWNIVVASQSQLDQVIENVTSYSDRGTNTCYFHLSLAGGNSYVLDIVKLMNISLTDGGSLIMESKGGVAEINCTASQSDLQELREVVQPISRASLVLMDGLVFTGCPVPIMIEEASSVVIQNCVFQ